LVGATGSRLGAIGYHVINNVPIQGPLVGVVMAKVDHLGGSLPPSTDSTPTFALFELKAFHDTCSCALVE